MNEWITDRLPTEDDSDIMGKVWIFEDGSVYWSDYNLVKQNEPWMPIKEPAPYVNPKTKRWKPEFKGSYWTIDGMSVIRTYWDNDIIDEARLAIGNCFKEQWHADECFESFVDILRDYNEGLYYE